MTRARAASFANGAPLIAILEFFKYLLYASSREPECDEVHTTGVWVGTAEPDVSLVSFCVPANPIRAALSMLTVPAEQPGGPPATVIFGAGFFDDAADVPGHPVLFYAMQVDKCSARSPEFAFPLPE